MRRARECSSLLWRGFDSYLHLKRSDTLTLPWRLLATKPDATVYGGPQAPAPGRVTLRVLQQKYRAGQKLSMVTAYDYPSAVHVDKAGIDILLIGDSAGMVIHGHDTTVPVTLEMMLMHCQAVSRGASRPFLLGDMPFGTYEISKEQAVSTAMQFLKQGNVDAVKVEGGSPARVQTVEAIVGAGIACMGHIGLTPQSVSAIGGFRPQAQNAEAATKLVQTAKALEQAGCFAVLMECVPAAVAAAVTKVLSIPTIGIGAGPAVSGQVLVFHDLLGMMSHPHHQQVTPKFCKQYSQVGLLINDALTDFRADVESGNFPGRCCGWWMDWLHTLPKLSDVPLLRKASDEQIAWLSHVHPVLGNRARQDRSNWTSMCQRVLTSAEHVWLHIPVLRPGTTAPWSHPVDVSCGGLDDETLQMLQYDSTCCDSRIPRCNSGGRDTRLAHAHDLFDWAHMIVSSRSFCLSDRNGNRLICLVPLADFANHATEPNTSFVLSTADCRQHRGLCPAHVLRSKRPLTGGQEVLLGYGSNKSNLLLLSCYGFCIPGNLADRLALGRPGAWRDHNEIGHDLKFVDNNILRALSDINPQFLHAFSGADGQLDMSMLHQDMHMRRLLVAAVSVGEGLKWAAESPTCIPAHAEDADPQVLEHAGRLKQAQAVKRRLDALAQHCSQSVATTVSTGLQLPEQWLSAVSENSHLASCSRQILAMLEQIWESTQNSR